MSSIFPTHFFNSDFTMPVLSCQTMDNKFSEQCILITASPQLRNDSTLCINVDFKIGFEVASLYSKDDKNFCWQTSDGTEIKNVRGWVTLPDLDTLSRENIGEDQDVIAIYTKAPESSELIAKVVTKIDTSDSNFVGWFPLPNSSAVLSPLGIENSILHNDSKYLCLVHYDDSRESSTWDIAYIGTHQSQIIQAVAAEITPEISIQQITTNITYLTELKSEVQTKALLSMLEAQFIKIVDCTGFQNTFTTIDPVTEPELAMFEVELLNRV